MASSISKYFKWRKYQKKILNDKSKLIAIVKARQIGLTELASVLAVMVATGKRKHDVWILGVNHEGSKEVLYRALKWYEVLSLQVKGLPKLVSQSTETISFSNGSRITALPCSAKAVRGKTGTVIMDEAAHYQDDEAIWTAIAPVVSSNSKLRLIMFSTPFGERGVFWRAVTGKLDGQNLKWSVHSIDVHQAIADGHTPDVLDLRPSFSEDQWAQEFLCSFLSQADKYFSVTLIQQCYAAELPPDEVRIVEKKILGIDLASKRDMSVTIECDWDGEDGYHIHSPNILSSRLEPKTYPEQFEIIKTMIRNNQYDKVIVDGTGPGAGLADFLKAEFGSKIIIHNSTAQWKERYIPAMKVDMESNNIEIENNPDIVYAFNAVKETRTAANNIVYSMPRDKDGHADLFSASVMAYSVVKKFPNEKQAPAIIVGRKKEDKHAKHRY